MNDLIVNGNTQAGRKAPIALERRLCLFLQCQVFGDPVDIGRCRSLPNVFAELQQNFRNNLAGALHRFDFFRALQMNHQSTF